MGSGLLVMGDFMATNDYLTIDRRTLAGRDDGARWRRLRQCGLGDPSLPGPAPLHAFSPIVAGDKDRDDPQPTPPENDENSC